MEKDIKDIDFKSVVDRERVIELAPVRFREELDSRLGEDKAITVLGQKPLMTFGKVVLVENPDLLPNHKQVRRHKLSWDDQSGEEALIAKAMGDCWGDRESSPKREHRDSTIFLIDPHLGVRLVLPPKNWLMKYNNAKTTVEMRIEGEDNCVRWKKIGDARGGGDQYKKAMLHFIKLWDDLVK